MRRLVTTSSLQSLARIAGAGAGFVTQVVLARTLHASALGVFCSVTSLAAVVGLIAAHGYPAIATVFWLLSCSIVLARISGLRTDAVYLLGPTARGNLV